MWRRQTPVIAIEGVELSMDALGGLTDGPSANAALHALVDEYRGWIRTTANWHHHAARAPPRHGWKKLLSLAGIAATRIERGIHTLATDADALDAFRIANRAVARALRQRLGVN